MPLLPQMRRHSFVSSELQSLVRSALAPARVTRLLRVQVDGVPGGTCNDLSDSKRRRREEDRQGQGKTQPGPHEGVGHETSPRGFCYWCCRFATSRNGLSMCVGRIL